jgi:prepilin-type processing-associated H-X9-DG protein
MNPSLAETTGTERTVFWIMILLGVLAIGVFLLLGVFAAWEKMVITGCRHQLKQIGLECRIYASEHDGRFPLNWRELESLKSGNGPKILRCPRGGHDQGDWHNVDIWSDYRLIAGRTTNDPPNTVLAIEALANHKAKGANVLFVDGSTSWWPLQRILTNR